MKLLDTKLGGVRLIEPVVRGDNRGFFMESYNMEQFQALGLTVDFVQDNHSLSAESGTLRGLHYQLAPKAQAKLVRVIAGAIYDVVLDIREGSPTYGQWEGFVLSASNHHQLFVPKGFAHGFCTLEDNTQVIYKVDEYYSPEHDRGIRWDDPALAIDWPVRKPVLSDKDGKHPSLEDAEHDFVYEWGQTG